MHGPYKFQIDLIKTFEIIALQSWLARFSAKKSKISTIHNIRNCKQDAQKFIGTMHHACY